jgi:hypothetical protein
MHTHIRRETHGSKHFGAEHATIPNLNPFFKVRMPGEDLEGGLDMTVCVSARIIPKVGTSLTTGTVEGE